MYNNTKFWESAARYGAMLGAVEAAFTAMDATLSPQSPTVSLMVSVADTALFVTLLTLFANRRAAMVGRDKGFTYGNCLKFILAMSLFAGVLTGAYSIVASNFLYPQKYCEIIDRVVASLSMTGLYSDRMLDYMRQIYEKVFFSPLWVVLTNVAAMAVKGLFFGLFVAAFARREPMGPNRGSQQNDDNDDDII